jgi:hypothetical protein
MNAKYAKEHHAPGRQDTIELLRRNSHAAAEACRDRPTIKMTFKSTRTSVVLDKGTKFGSTPMK